MTRTAFALRGVGYRIGDAVILEDVTLEIGYGRLLALVGPNGAGKSSLLGVLTGDLRPTAGRVSLDDRALAEWNPRRLSRSRAVLTQSNHVAFAFTALQVVEMGRAPWSGTERQGDDAAIIARSLAQADVAHLASRSYPSLSGGEKARVSLARVLAQDTGIVLLDEPTAALDLRHQEDVLRIARALARAGRAVVVVLHDLSLAGAYADDVAVIDRGRIVAHGSPDAVLTEARITDVYDTPVRVLRDPDTGRPIVLPRR
ncbi:MULTISPECIES: heme ABC transporter ATP-binding protein [unclassified Microbacterium]|uniref:heme ABC transporter ATP-binding protein n=1 Tax=unclassified Microbacterium TaxID=2609290 RepID=UPI00214BB59A|nr:MULTISPECIES: heme ABC transporter ATP-binding protein [unclassified Microbacterium]MCR2808215.1 heme ABC transporter ATP-binding protein [Microbacterium sp. zg.B185]WIM19325.1 heme ABC transporter ATP-binding protein [Microbacterium sp. zg-B185]